MFSSAAKVASISYPQIERLSIGRPAESVVAQGTFRFSNLCLLSTKSAPVSGADLHFHIGIKGASDGGGRSRSIGNSGASLHADGGALYSVTCSQRKYHNLCIWFLAHSLAMAACGAGSSRSIPSPTSFPGGISRRARRLAQHMQNVSDCPMQLYLAYCPGGLSA